MATIAEFMKACGRPAVLITMPKFSNETRLGKNEGGICCTSTAGFNAVETR